MQTPRGCEDHRTNVTAASAAPEAGRSADACASTTSTVDKLPMAGANDRREHVRSACCQSRMDTVGGEDTTELFDVIAEYGGLDESSVVSVFQALLPLCEHAAQSHPGFRLTPELVVFTKEGTLRLLARADGAASHAPKNEACEQEGKESNLQGVELEPYSPPEKLCDPLGPHDVTATTIWSLGVVLFALLAGYPPFAAASTACRQMKARLPRMARCRIPLLPHAISTYTLFKILFPHFFSKPAIALLCGMLALDPKYRFGFEQVLRQASRVNMPFSESKCPSLVSCKQVEFYAPSYEHLRSMRRLLCVQVRAHVEEWTNALAKQGKIVWPGCAGAHQL
eukprot:4702691-Pleurochrysis_carterae.AAC.3